MAAEQCGPSLKNRPPIARLSAIDRQQIGVGWVFVDTDAPAWEPKPRAEPTRSGLICGLCSFTHRGRRETPIERGVSSIEGDGGLRSRDGRGEQQSDFIYGVSGFGRAADRCSEAAEGVSNICPGRRGNANQNLAVFIRAFSANFFPFHLTQRMSLNSALKCAPPKRRFVRFSPNLHFYGLIVVFTCHLHCCASIKRAEFLMMRAAVRRGV